MCPQITLNPAEQELRSLLLDVAEYIGSQQGYSKPVLRFTGGWVRDKLLGAASHDIDVGISSLTGEKFGTLMKQYFLDPTLQSPHRGKSIGALSVIKENPDRSKHLATARTKICGIEVDLVNLRKETYSNNSRNPIVEFGTPEEDALRRDATVNALFYNLSLDQIEDPTGQGLRDMELKIIRTPMEPFQTFKDDPLRVLRCIRFASRLRYTIDDEAMRCMNNPEILSALRLKISRERIGDEISKMLKGLDPLRALSLIDSLGLFDVIFTDPSMATIVKTDTSGWHKVCGTLSSLFKREGPRMEILHSILVADDADAYLGWLMAAVVPLASHSVGSAKEHRKPTAMSPAQIAREGLKLGNAATHIINDAFEHLHEILAMKAEFLKEKTVSTQTQKTPFNEDLDAREKFGMAIRKWSSRKNSNWKLSTLFALLFEHFTAQTLEGTSEFTIPRESRLIRAESEDILRGYESWLLSLKEMDLLGVHSMVPILNGNEVMSAVGGKGGPWLNDALSDVVRWQLRNPGSDKVDEVRAEIVEKYK